LFSDARFRQALVIGIARGGVPVALELSRRIGADFAVGVTGVIRSAPPVAMSIGAATADGPCHVDLERALASGAVSGGLESLRAAAAGRARSLQERLGPECAPAPEGRVVLMVDEALLWEAPAIALARWARQRGAQRIVLAVPVAASAPIRAVRAEVDALVCLQAEPALDTPEAAYDVLPPVFEADLYALVREAIPRPERLGPLLWPRIADAERALRRSA
jgi:putative phosphoribosyl transferase